MEPPLAAFELLAGARFNVGPRQEARLKQLVHPVHASGRVCGWKITP
jgi:hypothetical protein